MMKVLYVISVIILFSCQGPANTEVQLLDSKEFADLIVNEDVQLVDVRTPDEYKNGFIGSAIKFDFYNENFKAQISQLDRNKSIAVYCAAGGRSGKAASMLKELGFKNIYDLKGGYSLYPKAE